MNLPRFALTHRSIVLAIVAVLFVVGTVNFGSMPRREDPQITIRDALIVTAWPGAPARRVEDLITDPIEDVVLEIPEIETVESKSMVGLSIIQVAAGDAVDRTEQVWDDVRAKVESVRTQLPPGAAPPFVNSDFGDVYEIVFALYQAPVPDPEHVYSARALETIAERIEEELERIDSVARVEFWGNQPERIYVEFDSAEWAKLDITANRLKELFQARNIVSPGGEFDTHDARYAIAPSGEFESLEQMRELVIARVDGRLPVQLGDLPVSIERRYEEPARSLARITTPVARHRTAIVLGVSMKSGRNVSEMSAAVDRAIDDLRATAIPPDLALARVNDLPRQVDTRIADFQINLVQGILIVLGVALITMGWRPALIMATAVPLSMVGAFAVVRYLGIELEQFSIASLIIALGMVVDNAIVVSDNAVRLIRQGTPKHKAVIVGAHDLAIPLLTSTLTTIAAFLPMLTLEGDVGEYVASLPVVVATTLAVSYFVAMLVTPIMCAWLLQIGDGEKVTSPRAARWSRAYDIGIRGCLARPATVVTMAAVALGAALLLLPVIGSQFFPSGSRDQFFIKVWLPEGAPIAATAEVARDVERILIEERAVPGESDEHRLGNAVSFIGSGGPRLMLTQEPEYPYPYYALVLVNTTGTRHTQGYAQVVRERLRDYVDARITVDQFMLGPPVKDPVAFRLSGPAPEVVGAQARDMLALFKQTPGVVRPYSNWGAGANQIELAIDAYAANLAGVTNADVAFTTNALLSGAELTTYREGNHSIPVLLRTIREKREALGDLADIFVNGQFGKVPLDSVAEVIPTLQPSVVARRNGLPTVTVGSRVEPGLLANTVAGRVQPKLEAMAENLGTGYSIGIDGELEETAKAQAQVVRAVGISVLLMVLILTVQYNSLVKPAVIMVAVPLGMIGVLIGLFVTGWAMGFMAMLGILSLGGIVINNAIVLVDFIESNVSAGQDLRQAVAEAGRVRMRPIILTTLTTIGGLLPLSLFGGALWAPMTNGMIFGLLVSTILTLFVIPSLYVLLVEKAGMKVSSGGAIDSNAAEG
ncbi:MAG: efflux RND transporter permease subunit [Gammaproteobacteria bacterium]